MTSGAGPGTEAVLLVAFESADHGLDAWMARALECARDHGGRVPDGAGRTVATDEGARDGAAGAWRRRSSTRRTCATHSSGSAW
jgi:alkyldihydroxyacetonephosphate synthase